MEKTFFLKISAGLLLTIALAGCGVGTKYVSFAQCLTDKGAKMYGAYWCPHCNDQKAMFGSAGVKKLTYIECDPKGPYANPQECKAKDIKGFPTWIFADGSRLSGTQELSTLAEKTTCTLPVEE